MLANYAFEPLEDIYVAPWTTQTATPTTTQTAAAPASPDYSGWRMGTYGDQFGNDAANWGVDILQPLYYNPQGQFQYNEPAGWNEYWSQFKSDPNAWTAAYNPTITEGATYESSGYQVANPDPITWRLNNTNYTTTTNPFAADVENYNTLLTDLNDIYYRTGYDVDPGGRPWYQVAHPIDSQYSLFMGNPSVPTYGDIYDLQSIGQPTGWDTINFDPTQKAVQVAPSLYAIKTTDGGYRLVSNMTGNDGQGRDMNIALPQNLEYGEYGLLPYAYGEKFGLPGADSVSAGYTILPSSMTVDNANDWLRYSYHTPGEEDNNILGPILAIASIIPSPIQPYAMAVNAAYSASQGNYLGAALSAFGAYNGLSGASLSDGSGLANELSWSAPEYGTNLYDPANYGYEWSDFSNNPSINQYVQPDDYAGAFDTYGSLASPAGYSPVTEGTMGTIFDPAAVNTINATETPMGTGSMDMYGSLGTPAVAGVGGAGYVPVDTQAYMDATGSSLSSALTGLPDSGTGIPKAVTDAAIKAAMRALGESGSGGALGSALRGFPYWNPNSNAIPRNRLPEFDQPAWLGPSTQPVGSGLDEWFTKMLGKSGDAISSRFTTAANSLGKAGWKG